MTHDEAASPVDPGSLVIVAGDELVYRDRRSAAAWLVR
jgi:hypothetical protein